MLEGRPEFSFAFINPGDKVVAGRSRIHGAKEGQRWRPPETRSLSGALEEPLKTRAQGIGRASQNFSKAEGNIWFLPCATLSLLGISASTASPESHLKGLGPMVLGSDSQGILQET